MSSNFEMSSDFAPSSPLPSFMAKPKIQMLITDYFKILSPKLPVPSDVHLQSRALVIAQPLRRLVHHVTKLHSLLFRQFELDDLSSCFMNRVYESAACRWRPHVITAHLNTTWKFISNGNRSSDLAVFALYDFEVIKEALTVACMARIALRVIDSTIQEVAKIENWDYYCEGLRYDLPDEESRFNEIQLVIDRLVSVAYGPMLLVPFLLGFCCLLRHCDDLPFWSEELEWEDKNVYTAIHAIYEQQGKQWHEDLFEIVVAMKGLSKIDKATTDECFYNSFKLLKSIHRFHCADLVVSRALLPGTLSTDVLFLIKEQIYDHKSFVNSTRYKPLICYSCDICGEPEQHCCTRCKEIKCCCSDCNCCICNRDLHACDNWLLENDGEVLYIEAYVNPDCDCSNCDVARKAIEEGARVLPM